MTDQIPQEVHDAIKVVEEAVQASGVQLPPGAPETFSWHFVAGMVSAHMEDARASSQALTTLQDAVGYAALHINERWVVSKLTTAQKEAWADAVEAFGRRLHADDPEVEVSPYDRWWRDA